MLVSASARLGPAADGTPFGRKEPIVHGRLGQLLYYRKKQMMGSMAVVTWTHDPQAVPNLTMVLCMFT